jgi:hypothetical protein
MITAEQFGMIVIKRVIFHDVPSTTKGATEKTPTLSEIETQIDVARKGMLKKKLIQALSSRSAYPIQFDISLPSPVLAHVRDITKGPCKSETFIDASQQMAKQLFTRQIGSVSPGLLCVIEVTVAGQAGAVLMKLERHEGAQLKMGKTQGKRTFSMEVLDDLVLTDGTRLFKAAIFLRIGPGDHDFLATACDNQLNVGSSSDVAKFWLRFLGCTFVVEPRVATERFFEASVRFVNETVADPVVKSEIYDALQSELKSSKKTFSPRSFLEEYVPEEYRISFQEHLQDEKIALTAFHKDLADISGKLRRRAYQTRNGALISIPETQAELITVGEEEIVIHDAVLKVR